MDKKYVTWDEIQTAIKNYDIVGKYGDVDIVVSIGSGGMIPGVIISKILGKPVVNMGVSTYGHEYNQTFTVKMYQKFDFKKSLHKKVLIVDDINDTGYTLTCINNHLMSGFHTEEDVKFFTVFSKPKSYFRCDSAIEVSNETWLVFPWEVNNE